MGFANPPGAGWIGTFVEGAASLWRLCFGWGPRVLYLVRGCQRKALAKHRYRPTASIELSTAPMFG